MRERDFEPMNPAEIMPKLYAACMRCGTVRTKKKMTTLYQRPPGEENVRPLKVKDFLCDNCVEKPWFDGKGGRQ